MQTHMHTHACMHTCTCMLNMLIMLNMDGSMLAAICNFYTCIKPDTAINVYTRFCLNTAKSKFSLVSPVAD